MAAAPILRFELYREVERGNADAGSGTHPCVERCELVPPAGVDPLALKLVLLPCFGEHKPDTTLGAYFKAQALGLDSPEGALLPSSLEGYLRHEEAERRAFGTLVEPGSEHSSVLVVWNGRVRWYVDAVFHRLEGVEGWTRGACVDVVEGSLKDFIRFSPLIQPRLSEGRPGLRHPGRAREFSADACVLKLSKSPGMPNTRHFSLEAFADGRFERRVSRESDFQGLDVHQLTTLLIAASRMGEVRGPSGPPPFAHDKQKTSVTFPVSGGTRKVTLDPETSPEVEGFVQQVAAAYGLER
ncbi:hypothetical protein G4177_32360 [Corallococcus sp. ZKHCc1 1396]|uniref:Uncharacterized protein n=1 Tax=Corallococcus soli TaxID=2710757 RepID=A0ABR9PY50_9BACT|nr:hypothetical protein [Corallococcus soli]MBE4752855.1 hypothetical protein [Corallococcus soli]